MNLSTQETPTRYDGIQCLRAVAAILVAWAHLKFAGDFGHNSIISSSAGASGVDIFFIISGFVISMSAVRLKYNWRAFLGNRLCRIVPFYWLMSAPAFVLALSPHLNQQALLNTFTFIPLFNFNTFAGTLHACGWTLSFEFWFYTLFAALLAIWGARALSILPPLLASLSVLVWLLYKGSWFTPHFLFHPLTLEFAAGVLVYRTRNLFGSKALMIGVVFAVLLGWLTLKTQFLGWHVVVLARPELGFLRALVWGGLGLALVIVSVAAENLQLIRWAPAFVLLGDCSFSMYLIQPYSLIVAQVTHGLLGRGLVLDVICGTIFMLGTIIGGIILSKCVEMPLTRWVKQIFVATRPQLEVQGR